MFRTIPRYFEYNDSRGSLSGLINVGNWREVNIITSEAGTIRGRHYHERTLECFAILEGTIHVIFRRPLADGSWEKIARDFGAGDVFIVEPYVEHTFYIQDSAQWINLLSQPVDPQQPDFHKYPDSG